MAKYSTGGNRAGGDGDTCELCGRETSDLRRATVAGARLLVCEECAPHGDADEKTSAESGSDSGERNRKKRAAQRTAQLYDASKGDSSHWEREGTNYEKDRLPYLVSDYGAQLERARQEAGLTVEELAAELDLDEDDVLAVEQGRATRANVGGTTIRALEERLDVELAED